MSSNSCYAARTVYEVRGVLESIFTTQLRLDICLCIMAYDMIYKFTVNELNGVWMCINVDKMVKPAKNQQEAYPNHHAKSQTVSCIHRSNSHRRNEGRAI